MDTEILALADPDRDYLEKFTGYFNENYNGTFECHTFTGVDSLLRYGLENKISMLLMAEELYEEAVKRIDAGNIFLLSEEAGEGTDGIRRIDRYRTADGIIREIMKARAESGEPEIRRLLLEESRIITVFSPVSRVLKTTFAIALGQILSDRAKVIYLNMEPFSGFHQIFMQKYEADLSDLLFYLKNGSKNFSYRLKSITLTSQGLDYVPPVMSPEDLLSADKEDWEKLIKELTQAGYEIIILDPGSCMNGLNQILKKSEKIYVPMRNDSMSKAKTAQFEAMLRIRGEDETAERLERLQFPYFEDMVSIAGNLRETGLGKFIRERLDIIQ
ncbi:MAG: hypothetical protein K6F35_04960 [Lachnospiraceae bacterium]|nr:hypothetical protein [Lachnospiraceae bacterium]